MFKKWHTADIPNSSNPDKNANGNKDQTELTKNQLSMRSIY